MRGRLLDGRLCEVLERACVFRACLRPGYHVTRSAGGSWTDSHLSCVQWTDFGCPPPEARRLVILEDLHGPGHPRFACTVRTPHARGTLPCLCGCNRRFPRQMISTWQGSCRSDGQ